MTYKNFEKTVENAGQIYDKFLDGHGSGGAVRKYTTGAAGYGINYLSRRDYAQVYLSVVEAYLRTSGARPLRVLKLGCDGGANVHPPSIPFTGKGNRVERAYGADFSPCLMQTVEQEAAAFLPQHLAS